MAASIERLGQFQSAAAKGTVEARPQASTWTRSRTWLAQGRTARRIACRVSLDAAAGVAKRPGAQQSGKGAVPAARERKANAEAAAKA